MYAFGDWQTDSGYDEAPRGAGRYHRTAKVITSGGNRNPANAEVGTGEAIQRAALMHQAWQPLLPSRTQQSPGTGNGPDQVVAVVVDAQGGVVDFDGDDLVGVAQSGWCSAADLDALADDLGAPAAGHGALQRNHGADVPGD
jgi:hypothetical protein